MKDAGYVEGQNVAIDFRCGEGQYIATLTAGPQHTLLRQLLEITALSHANTNGVTRGGDGTFLLSLGHASSPIGLELFPI